ncbi:hypothetical protein LWI28_006850 [Acer negundo]|uniref:Uncharacterized protein n=1 Tax=Acer negundo TaxID=4023 RepID=A0AAD5NSA9_ACENE|nr:hypothetical protein LWI28_006850 [Acer negundo]
MRAVKEEILREIAASEGRTRAVISDVEDGLMQDFAELRTELKRSLKELADKEAAASDPLGKGKRKLPGTS